MGIAVIPAPGGGVTRKVDLFNSTATWTAPSNCFSVEVFLVGGGGGGGAYRHTSSSGGSGGGGGGAVLSWRKLPVTPGTSYTVTIGAGGAGSVDSLTGGLGGDTSFGSLLTAFGGGGGGTYTSSGTDALPTVKGTSGGRAQFSGSGSGGGGAASTFYPFIGGATNPFQLPLDGQSYTSINNVVQGGLTPGGNSSMAGFGIEGFGGGGQGGRAATATTFNRLSIHGGGVGGNANSNGGNATANTGGGGGGSYRDNTGQYSGGNGGSGYAVVVYYS